MNNSGNINQGKTPDHLAFIPPPVLTDETANPVRTVGISKKEVYYTDSLARDVQEKAQRGTSLNTIPPPNAQSMGVSGAAGTGNLFLTPNPLVAFFINFNELSRTLRDMSIMQANISLMEMGLILDLAKGEAEQILKAAKAESKMYIAAAVASFTEGATSLISGSISFGVDWKASKQLKADKKTSVSEASQAKTDVTQPKIDNNIAKTKLNSAEANLQNSRADLDNARSTYLKDPSKENKQQVKDAKQKVTNAETDVNNANKDYRTSQRNLDKAEARYENAKRESENFDAHYLEKRQGLVQTATFKLQMFNQFINKMTDAAANLVKAGAALEKGQAEAEQKMLAAYQQTANRMLGNLDESRKANSQFIAELMRMLQQFSDQAKKSGGTITAAAAA